MRNEPESDRVSTEREDWGNQPGGPTTDDRSGDPFTRSDLYQDRSNRIPMESPAGDSVTKSD